jgi:hypothetical protein
MRNSASLAIGLCTAAVAVAASCGSEQDGTGPKTTAGGGTSTASGGGTGGSHAGGGGDGGFVMTTGGGDTGGSENCGQATVEATLAPANILFVIDRSGSMSCNPPPLQPSGACELDPTPVDPNQDSKWDVVKQALKTAISKMTPTTSVGLSYFNTDGYCGVAQAPAVPLALVDAAQIAAIEASIDGVKPKGATPIVGGVTLGYAHLHGEVALAGNDFAVLLTDGAETCAPQLQETLVNQTVPDALSVNIRTFVIGAPGSEPARALLSRIAWAGGTAKDPLCKHDAVPANVGDCHFDMTDPNLDFATELNAALSAISGQALACELDVPAEVGKDVDYDKVNVEFTPGSGKPVSILQDNKPCDQADGWQYNDDKTKILLCGGACDLVKSDTKGKITITLGCQTEVAK